MNNFSFYSHNKKALLLAIKTFPSDEQSRITKALELAEHYHANQKRNEIEPEGAGYIIHPVRVALWLVQQQCTDTNIIIAAILHDTLEDTVMTRQEIEDTFGREVLRLVEAVTRPGAGHDSEVEKRRTKPIFYKKVLQNNEKVRLIKTADYLDNMRSWAHIDPNNPSLRKFPRWIDEAKRFAIPIAQSVNMSAAKEMEELVKNRKTL